MAVIRNYILFLGLFSPGVVAATLPLFPGVRDRDVSLAWFLFFSLLVF